MAEREKKVSIGLPIVLYKLRRREETSTRDTLKGEC